MEETRSFGYVCPKCGKAVVARRSKFALSAAAVRMECPKCGESALEVQTDGVPVSRKRLRQRGFDQSRLLAASLCVDWHVAPVETLRKAVDNPAQSGLTDAEHRRANVLGVYEALPENVRDKRLLLIDDIVTTGSTLTECVRVLREAGAADVVCLTLARTGEEH